VSYYKFAGLTLACAAVSLAQDVISAHSGLIHYNEGMVLLDGKQLTRKAAEFPAMKAGQELRTEQGRAEVLLTPSVVLRMAEESAFRLSKNELMDSRLEMLAGSAILEVGEVQKGQSLTMALASSSIEFDKKGLFRLDADPARIRVYDGSAIVVTGDDAVTLKEGRQATLGAMVVPTKFDKEDTDAFYRWAERRSGYLAVANIAAAKRAHDNSTSFTSGNWIYNPYFGMFTYLPLSGIYRNPYGFSYYSPLAVSRVYYRPSMAAFSPSMGSSMPAQMGPSMRGSMDMGGSRSVGSYGGGGAMAAPAPSSAPAAPSGARGGGGGGARGGR